MVPRPVVDAITSNPLQTRSDAVDLLLDLLAPLVATQSPGGARIRLGNTGTVFDVVAAELEGYTRALWGLAPALAAEPNHPRLRAIGDRWCAGLDNGTNPDVEDEFWGWPVDRDQRFVEMAAIGVAIAIAPTVFWTPLSPEAKVRVNKWLLTINDHEVPTNNWRFFRVFVNVGLKIVGANFSAQAIEDELNFIDTFYGDHGFPSDGPNDTINAYDYYATSFAIPFYGLMYARLNPSDTVRAKKFRERATLNLDKVIHLFAPDGSAIAFGRSMTYRFAVAAFWSAVAYDHLDLPAPFTWGVIKGLVLRTIRWFTQKRSVFNRDGSLSIGWAYPTLFMSENYNSPQSPYWALKTFLVMALPESHPFWAAKEEAIPAVFSDNAVVKPWTQVFTHAAGHTFLLTAGQHTNWPMRQTAGKYGKMAYSAAFGFSVQAGQYGLEQFAPDSTLSVCDDSEGEHWIVPRLVENVSISDAGVIQSTWKPKPDVSITTWLIPPENTPWHTRVHKITTARALQYSSAGFAIHSTTGPAAAERYIPVVPTLSVLESQHGRYTDSGGAVATSRAGVSGVYDLLGTGAPRIIDADGNSNLISPRTVFPTIVGTAPAGDVTWVAVRVFAIPAATTGAEPKWLDDWQALKPWEEGDMRRELPLIPSDI